MNLWVRHAILCKVKVLKVRMFWKFYLVLDDLPVVSQNLTRHLSGVRFHNSATDFSCCPALEHLELHECGLMDAKKIMSKSLKHLNDSWERTPMLDPMPSLVEAFVRITEWCCDICAKDDDPDCDDCLLSSV
ncbi:hypothetical protein EJB05_36922, partial [Eragrostis curvula]